MTQQVTWGKNGFSAISVDIHSIQGWSIHNTSFLDFGILWLSGREVSISALGHFFPGFCWSSLFIHRSVLWWRGLCNSVELWAMWCRATQDGWVIVESSDKTWSTGGGNGKPLQCSCLENPMNSMKKQKDMTPEEKPPKVRRCPICSWGRAEKQIQKEWKGWSRKNEEVGPKQKWCSAVDVSAGENKVWCYRTILHRNLEC